MFFHNLFLNVPNMGTHNLVIAGDANCRLSVFDRSSSRRACLSKTAQSINLLLEKYGKYVLFFATPSLGCILFLNNFHQSIKVIPV